METDSLTTNVFGGERVTSLNHQLMTFIRKIGQGMTKHWPLQSHMGARVTPMVKDDTGKKGLSQQIQIVDEGSDSFSIEGRSHQCLAAGKKEEDRA